MKLPALTVDLKKVEHNTRTIVDISRKAGIKVAAVTKLYCANPIIAEASVRGGVDMLADSRIENLKKLKSIDIPKIMLRLPMISQVEDVVEYADISLNSEYKTIKSLSEAALKKGRVHNIILMIDLGDLREGLFRQKAIETAGKVLDLKGIKLMGIGTNLTCYGGVLASEENLGLLSDIAIEIENKYNIQLEIVSGGNSSSFPLVRSGKIPERINHLRFGETILFGTECTNIRIDGTYSDVFKFHAEIIEIQEKPSIPIGEIGLDAFGETPTFVDRGWRKRAILGIGRQDIIISNIKPVNKDIIIIGGSSDHLIVDISDSENKYDIGDVLEFDTHYTAVLQAMTSEYVEKVIIK